MTGNEWSRFEKICEAAREKNKNDASVVSIKIFAQAAFHTYFTGAEAQQPLFEPPPCLVLLEEATLPDVQIFMRVYRMNSSSADIAPAFVAAIRGTVHLENWLVNLQATLVPADERLIGEVPTASVDSSGPVAPMVHYAWQKIAIRLNAELEKVLPEQIQDAQGSASQLYCVGHSLGGSLSVLLALAWSQHNPACEVHALTWAAPMVGNDAFNEVCKVQLASDGGQPRVVQFVNEADVVPKLPLAALGFSAWSETRVNIDTPGSRNILGPLAAAPCAVSMLRSGRRTDATKRILDGAMKQVEHMHSCDVYFNLTLCWLGEGSSGRLVDKAEDDDVAAPMANALRTVAVVADGIRPAMAGEAGEAVATLPAIPPMAGLILGAGGLAVSLIGHSMTMSSLSRLEERVGSLKPQLEQVEVGLVKKMECVHDQLSSQIASLQDHAISKLEHIAGSIPGLLRDARLDEYKEKLFAAVGRLHRTTRLNDDGAATDEIIRTMREIDEICGWIKQWMLKHSALVTDEQSAEAQRVLFMLMLVHAECVEVLAKASDEAQVTQVLEKEVDTLKWLAEKHGNRLWMSGGVDSQSIPYALEGCLLLSQARATLIDIRPQLAEQHGLKEVPDGKNINTCFRAIAFDPTNWMPWLHVANHRGFLESMPSYAAARASARACKIAAGALADGDVGVVMAAASQLEDVLKQAHDETLDGLPPSHSIISIIKPTEWLAEVAGAYFVHVHSPAVMPCMKHLVCRLADTQGIAAGESKALDFLRATHQMVQSETSEALPEMMRFLSDSFADASSAAEPALYVGLSAALRFCIDSMREMGQHEMGFVFSDGMRVSLSDLELPERITYNAAAMAQVTMARAQYLRLFNDTVAQFDSFAQPDIMCPHQVHVLVLQQRAEHLTKLVEIEKLRLAYLRELRSKSPDVDQLQQIKERLSSDSCSDSWLAALAVRHTLVSKATAVRALLSQCKGDKADCNAILDQMVSKDLPHIINSLASVGAQREVKKELQTLEKGTKELEGELCSTVVFTGTTSAGKTTSICAMLCSAEQPLCTALLPSSEYENTNSVTELCLHPMASDLPLPPRMPSIKRSVGAFKRDSFDTYEQLNRLLVQWEVQAHQGGQMEVDSRAIDLYQSRLDVEMILIDTPGLNGTNDKVREALECIVQEKLFICVVVINCTSPSPIGGEVLTTLRKLAEISHKARAHVPPVIVFTHWDRVTDKKGLEIVLQRLAGDLRAPSDEGGPAVLSKGSPCFFASINGHDALKSFEEGLEECAARRDIDFLLDFLSMYCGGLEGMLRSLKLLSQAESTVQNVTNTLFKNNSNTKLFSDLSKKQLDEKADNVKNEFKDKLEKKLKMFPDNAAELRRVVAVLASTENSATGALSSLLENAEIHGPMAMDEKPSLRPADGRRWTTAAVWGRASMKGQGWSEMEIKSSTGLEHLGRLLKSRAQPIQEFDRESLGGGPDADKTAWLFEWEQLSVMHGIVLRKNQYVVIDGECWVPKSVSRNMITYQTELSKYFSKRFGPEYLREIAALQKESMDELTEHIEGMLDVDKFIPGAMEQVKKISLATAGVGMSLGMGATAAIVSSSTGVLASLGAISATGVGLVVALPLMGLAGWWGWKQTYGLSEEGCVDKTLDYFLDAFTKQIPEFKTKVIKEFDKTVDSFVEKLKNYRSQTESPELEKAKRKSTVSKEWIEKELGDVLKELHRMDSWLCGDAELEKIVKGTRLVEAPAGSGAGPSQESEPAAISAEEARRKAEAEAEARRKAKAEAEARRKAEAEAEEARRKAEAEAEEARRKAEAEAEARRKAGAEAEEARRKAEAEVEALPTPRGRALLALLERAKLTQYASTLQDAGYAEVEDLKEADDEHLGQLGLKKPEIKRMRRYQDEQA